MSKYIVTGGGGFIGAHLVAALASRGHEVVAIDRVFPGIRKRWWSQATRIVHQDLRTPSRYDLSQADMVFHLAADMGGVGYFHSAADQGAARNNMRIDLQVLDAVRDTPLFYASSACALPHDETTLREASLGGGPADQLYGEQKRMMSLLLAKQPNARVGLFHTIYGPGQEYDGPRAKFPPAICHKVKTAARTGGTVEVWGDGTQMRTFLYIDDAITKILEVALDDGYWGPVNIGSDIQVTVTECAELLLKHAGLSGTRIVYDLTKPTGVMLRGTDNTEYDLRYGRDPSTPPSEGLARLYDWLP